MYDKLITAINDWHNFGDVLEITAAPTGDNYKFNVATGIPDHVMKQTHEFLDKHKGKTLNYSRHAVEQAQNSGDGKHGVHPSEISGKPHEMPHPSNGSSIAEVEHDSNKVTKVVLRKPMKDGKSDAVMPIVETPQGNPMATTIWKQDKQDNHKSLNMNKVHTPDEFVPGVKPKRKLA